MLAEEHLNVERLAKRLNQNVEETWSQLIEAATAAVVRWCAMRRTAISPAKRAEMRGDYLWI
jgi:hypothetical protein